MVENEEAMLLAIQRRQLAFHCASFSRDVLHILDAYYRSKGLPHLKNRTAGYPERVSTLLHWRNIHSLLRYCHTRQPTKPLAVKIENTRLLPTFSVSLLSGKRSVQQNPVPVPSETRIVMCTTKRPSAALGAPVPSVSHGDPSTSYAQKASVQKLQKIPNKTSLIILLDEDTAREFYMDAYCHLDRLFAHEPRTGTLFEYMEKKNRYVCPAFTRCVTVFCDYHFFMFQRERVENMPQEKGVFPAVG